MNADIPMCFKLPRAWLVMVLSEWLDLPSIGMLDTAVSSKKHRPQFLRDLSSVRSTSIDRFSCAFRGDPSCSKARRLMEHWWRWLSVRQIHVENIDFYGRDVRFDLAIPSIRRVKITDCATVLRCDASI